MIIYDNTLPLELQTRENRFSACIHGSWASLVTQAVNHLPEREETWVRSLGREDPLEKEMAAHSSILVWEIPWTEEPGRLPCTPMGEIDSVHGKTLLKKITVECDERKIRVM